MMIFTISSSQVVIDRQVIGSSGGSFDIGNSLVIEQTIGEPVIETVSDNSVTLTQGFQQPLTEGLLQFDVATISASCPTSSDGGAFITEITGCIPPYSIEWSNGITQRDSLDRLLPGLYSVTITAGFCQETVEFEVVSGPAADCELRIFNAFTPDGDGKSDTWTIENIDLPDFRENRVEIFNRWGQEVFSTENYDNRERVWNGEDASGNELLSGTYFYIVESGGITYKGYIELIR
jgi:gliding motility-associated-like protein